MTVSRIDLRAVRFSCFGGILALVCHNSEDVHVQDELKLLTRALLLQLHVVYLSPNRPQKDDAAYSHRGYLEAALGRYSPIYYFMHHFTVFPFLQIRPFERLAMDTTETTTHELLQCSRLKSSHGTFLLQPS